MCNFEDLSYSSIEWYGYHTSVNQCAMPISRAGFLPVWLSTETYYSSVRISVLFGKWHCFQTLLRCLWWVYFEDLSFLSTLLYPLHSGCVGRIYVISRTGFQVFWIPISHYHAHFSLSYPFLIIIPISRQVFNPSRYRCYRLFQRMRSQSRATSCTCSAASMQTPK